jgi:hypothetical protein
VNGGLDLANISPGDSMHSPTSRNATIDGFAAWMSLSLGSTTTVSRAVIREWLGRGSDAMIDRYIHELGKHGKAKMAKSKPMLDPIRTQMQREENGASPQPVVN